MDPNQSNQNNSSAGGSRQAIFTPQPIQPEASANTNTPAQPSTVLSHPYFSNHPTQTFNNEAGDIILNAGSQKPKHNKRPFIIGGIILAAFAVICVVVLVVVQAITKPSKADVINSFEAYKSYIEYGPDNSGNEDDWYLEQLSDYLYDTSDVAKEVEKINTLYSDFKNKLQESGIKISEELQGLISTESALLEYALLYINLDNIVQPQIEAYLDTKNTSDAQTLANQVLPAQSGSSFRDDFRDALLQYIISDLEIQKFYNNNYCIDNGIVSSSCIALLDADPDYIELLQQSDEVAFKLQQYVKRLWVELEACTNAVSEGLDE